MKTLYLLLSLKTNLLLWIYFSSELPNGWVRVRVFVQILYTKADTWHLGGPCWDACWSLKIFSMWISHYHVWISHYHVAKVKQSQACPQEWAMIIYENSNLSRLYKRKKKVPTRVKYGFWAAWDHFSYENHWSDYIQPSKLSTLKQGICSWSPFYPI